MIDREQEGTPHKSGGRGNSILLLAVLAATVGYVAVRVGSLPAKMVRTLLEEVRYIDSVEWVASHPSFCQIINLGIRDVCRVVTAQDTLHIRLYLEAGRGNGIERILNIEARARVLITLPVVVRYGIDLSSEFPTHELRDGVLRIGLPTPEVIGWHISHATMPIIEAELRRSLLTTPYELYTQTLRSVSDSVAVLVDSYSPELISGCRERTENLLEHQFRGFGVANKVEIVWRERR